jgi:16S rRNA (cytosine1402-N4)-methyltransferase
MSITRVGGVSFHHIPVLLDQTVGLFKQTLSSRVGGARLLDCTIGGGGHARGLLDALPSASLLGLDVDSAAVAAARETLKEYGTRVKVVQARWPADLLKVAAAAAAVVTSEATSCVYDGILLDAGVSSHQLDTPGRGFSFKEDGPLDMRMGGTDDAAGITAYDLVNTAPEAALRGAISSFGEENQAGTIARAIVNARDNGKRKITSTLELARIISRAVGLPRGGGGGGGGGGGKKHPATRTFQALRIAVNNELNAIDHVLTLQNLPKLLAPGGLLAVITFHSLEARLVKSRFNDLVSMGGGEWIAGGLILPTLEESKAQPRCRSAQLRFLFRSPLACRPPPY